RSKRDWSSDVCSSDLYRRLPPTDRRPRRGRVKSTDPTLNVKVGENHRIVGADDEPYRVRGEGVGGLRRGTDRDVDSDRLDVRRGSNRATRWRRYVRGDRELIVTEDADRGDNQDRNDNPGSRGTCLAHWIPCVSPRANKVLNDFSVKEDSHL